MQYRLLERVNAREDRMNFRHQESNSLDAPEGEHLSCGENQVAQEEKIISLQELHTKLDIYAH